MTATVAAVAVLWAAIGVGYALDRRRRHRAAAERVSWRAMDRLNHRGPR